MLPEYLWLLGPYFKLCKPVPVKFKAPSLSSASQICQGKTRKNVTTSLVSEASQLVMPWSV